MNVVLAAAVTVAASAVSIALILRVRRYAPDGGFFNDGDRAAGVFGVLATGFALLLGFVVFLAFTKYDESRAGAESEALLVIQQFETAQLMPEEVRASLSGALMCYGRSVVASEWPAMQSGDLASQINPWGVIAFQAVLTAEPGSPTEESAFDSWLGQTSAREEARRDRLHAADGIVPLPVWLVLFVTAALVIVYSLFFADSGERAVVQALLAGAVTAIVVLTLIVLSVLNHPYQPGIGGLRPVAMERSLEIIDDIRGALSLTDPLPCDGAGRPV
jgi:hypothetical protein